MQKNTKWKHRIINVQHTHPLYFYASLNISLIHTGCLEVSYHVYTRSRWRDVPILYSGSRIKAAEAEIFVFEVLPFFQEPVCVRRTRFVRSFNFYILHPSCLEISYHIYIVPWWRDVPILYSGSRIEAVEAEIFVLEVTPFFQEPVCVRRPRFVHSVNFFILHPSCLETSYHVCTRLRWRDGPILYSESRIEAVEAEIFLFEVTPCSWTSLHATYTNPKL